AKDLVDGAPKPVLERANKEDAEKAKGQVEGAALTTQVKEGGLGSGRRFADGRNSGSSRTSGPDRHGLDPGTAPLVRPPRRNAARVGILDGGRWVSYPGQARIGDFPPWVVNPCASGYDYWLPCLLLTPSSVFWLIDARAGAPFDRSGGSRRPLKAVPGMSSSD